MRATIRRAIHGGLTPEQWRAEEQPLSPGTNFSVVKAGSLAVMLTERVQVIPEYTLSETATQGQRPHTDVGAALLRLMSPGLQD